MSTSTTDLATHRNAHRVAFARVVADNPKLTISGYYTPCLPPPFTPQEIDLYTPMFARCLAWIKAFHSVAPAVGAGVESCLSRDAMKAWAALRGDTAHIHQGVYIAAATHLKLAGPRRARRADVWVALRLSTTIMALDYWTGPDRHDDDAPVAIEAVVNALKAARA